MRDQLVLYTHPIGKGRLRFDSRGRAYTPQQTREYERLIRSAWHHAGKSLHHGPVTVELRFCLKIPESWSKGKKLQAEEGSLYPTVKPDIDNLIKACLDALNGYAYDDDKAVIAVLATKGYAREECVKIIVEDVEDAAQARLSANA